MLFNFIISDYRNSIVIRSFALSIQNFLSFKPNMTEAKTSPQSPIQKAQNHI